VEKNMTTYGEIKISGFSDIIQILALSLQQGINAHSHAHFKGMLSEGTNPEQLQMKMQSETISIVSKKSGSERKLFVGYLNTVKIEKMGEGLHYVEVDLLSTSCKLDQSIKNRSFQDVSLTHEQVMENVAGETQMATILWNIEESSAISKPVIQYNETDWEFIVRMASYYGNPVIPSMTIDTPVLSIGFLKSAGEGKLEATKYKSGMSEAYYALGGSTSGISKGDYLYYKVESTKAYNVGQTVNFQGATYMICDMKARIYQSELIYSYTLGQDVLHRVKRIYNTNFIGHTILGTVIETEAETLKLHLDLSDESGDDSTAYPYEWTPETGNIMYCMPQKGTIASLYFSDFDEASGAVVNCIRKNGATSKHMENTSNKRFTTEDGLNMCLKEDVIDFSLPEADDASSFAKFTLPDDYGVAMLTQGKITIAATNNIEIQGERVGIWSQNGTISLVAYSEAPSCILLNYQFDIRGELSKIITNEMSHYARIRDNPTVSKCDTGKLILGILAGVGATLLATAAVVGGIALCCTGLGIVVGGPVIVGAIAGGISCGLFTTGYMAYQDVKNGTNTDPGKFALRAGTQAFIGAVAGAVAGTSVVANGVKGAKVFLTAKGLHKAVVPFVVNFGLKGTIEAGFNTAGQVADNYLSGAKLTDNVKATILLSYATYGIFDGEAGIVGDLFPGYRKLFGKGGDMAQGANDLIDESKIAEATVVDATTDVATAEAAEQAAKAAKRRAKQLLNSTRNKGGNTKAANAANRTAKEELVNAKALTNTAQKSLNSAQNKFNLLAQACGENNILVKQQLHNGNKIKTATDFMNNVEKMVERQVVIDCMASDKKYDVEFEKMFVE
jgi:hypothetical protein